MSYTSSPEARRDTLDGMLSALGPGSSLTCYEGARPENPRADNDSLQIVRFDLQGFARADSNGSAAILGTPVEARATAIGKLQWFRLARPDGLGHLDGEIGPGKEFDPGVTEITAVGQIVRIDGGAIRIA